MEKMFNILERTEFLPVLLSMRTAEGIKLIQRKIYGMTAKSLDFFGATWELSSLVVHEGREVNEGHYYSVVRTNLNGKTAWTKFDDTKSSKKSHFPVGLMNCYILFLVKK